MFGRGFLFVAVIVAAIAIPYLLVHDDGEPGHHLARLWDSVFQNEDRLGAPVPSASPIPSRAMPRSGFPAGPLAAPSTNRPKLGTIGRGTSPLGTSPLGTSAQGSHALPPGATATPWMPVDGSSPAAPVAAQRGSVVPGTAHSDADSSLVRPAAQNLGDLFRFDITPAWVVQNWPRVSSQLAEFSYTGLRVPVVSGTSIYDLAGSMTYYFDSRQQLQRMVFTGTTGDASQLIELARSRFRMQQAMALDGTCYVTIVDNAVRNMLRLQHVSVAKSNRPHQRYRATMEVNRPGNGQNLSAPNAQKLENERKIMEMGRATAPSPTER